MSTSPDNQIAQWMATAITRALNLDVGQCFPAAAPDYDVNWKGDFIVEVVPGDIQPYGAGEGSQEGGALLREQPFVLWCFYRAKLDQFSRSTMLLVEAERGILDRFEVLRRLFSFWQFPTADAPTATDFALIEPVFYRGEGKTEWEEPQLRVVRRSMTLVCRYGVSIPDGGITRSDYV